MVRTRLKCHGQNCNSSEAAIKWPATTAEEDSQKKRQQALARNDANEAAALAAEISALGGIEEYQKASLQGQKKDRGGDSSRVLLEWLRAVKLPRTKRKYEEGEIDGLQRLRMLEVGALSTENACSKSGLFDMEHIDLNSQQPGILQQDFMERPLPNDDTERCSFAHCRFSASPPTTWQTTPANCCLPLDELMAIFGYIRKDCKITNKQAYSLWNRTSPPRHPLPALAKKELNPGLKRNNFTITLRP
ncbi:25S rRNA adenine-N(1) methyltransferase [Colletotrichum orbiculare MAFF 240422]|uniref:25S rRNA adenine-N(1) methyltransferase n=1 Tax=Colletotrichum orbiculare (strain 104-T / ATCC 96160 / CBS 514.97 / LARS 414 / MAFF 240422) TaxID=1213857 RepID=A0A484FH37_COLOR|nr:25S rRNA adenine-N(1) methyltransferase [Colletotrichum orbiculare MAFF 240422]